MNVKLIMDAPHPGIMGQFMYMLPNALPYDVDKLYFYTIDRRMPKDAFDLIFDQDFDDTYTRVFCNFLGVYAKEGIYLGNIEDSKEFGDLKNLCKKIKVKHLDKTLQMTSKTLGVHIRAGDMNDLHPVYGKYYIEDYIEKIEEVLKSEDIDQIYVASDNFDSITQIEKRFGNVVYYDCKLRDRSDRSAPDLIHGGGGLINPLLWEEIMIETINLSRCSQVICRVSNVINAAILFSDTITKIHRL